MGRRDPRVDAYIKKSAPFAKTILKHLRKIVHTGCPAVEETIKWQFPHFDYKGMMCSMAAFTQHCSFGFWKGTLIFGNKKTEREAMYVANEGKLVAVIAASEANRILAAMKSHPLGKDAAIIGEVTADHPGFVMMTTRVGGTRVVDMLSGEQLPRIC